MQAELGTGPVNYRDAKGHWQPIDTRIVPLDRNGFAFGSTKNGFGSLFGNSSDRLLRMEQGGRQVTLGLPGPATALAPRVRGSTITYPGALGDGADLVWRATPQGLKEQIVLSGPPKDATWRFSLRLGGMVARAQPGGSIGLFPTGSGDVPLWVMPKPFMTNATDDASSPYGKGYSEQVTQTVAQHGDRVEVTVRANQAWLGAAERRWPVVVDPTIKIQPTDWSQSLDVEIRSDLPTDNLDDLWQLAVGSTTAIKSRALVDFPPDGYSVGDPDHLCAVAGLVRRVVGGVARHGCHDRGAAGDGAVGRHHRDLERDEYRLCRGWVWHGDQAGEPVRCLAQLRRQEHRAGVAERHPTEVWVHAQGTNETLNQGGPVYVMRTLVWR